MNTLMKKRANGNLPATSFSGIVDDVFQNNLNRFFDDNFWGFGRLDRKVSVPVNIRQTDNSYELQLVAPGLKKEDFEINLSGEMLTVNFEHRDEKKEQNQEEGWLRKEYKQQSFSRSFNLDDTIDANNIKAQYLDGILHLSLPVKEGAKTISRSIPIS